MQYLKMTPQINSYHRGNRGKFFPKTKKQTQILDKLSKHWEEDIKAGFESTRSDHSDYLWWMLQYVNKYYSWNDYDNVQCNQITGIWNESKQIIEFNDEFYNRIKQLEELLAKLGARVE
jgi:hypothetical protein